MPSLALFLGALLGSLVFGYLADRLGTKRILMMLYLGAFVFIPLLSIHMSLLLTTVIMTIVGTCTMGAQNVTHGYVTQYYPPAVRTTMMGWGLGLGRFGGLLGPAVGGVLLSLKATLFQSFLAFAVPSFISCVAIALVQEQYGYNAVLERGLSEEVTVSSNTVQRGETT